MVKLKKEIEELIDSSKYQEAAELVAKYDPDSFENFCSEYGYDTMSDKAEKTYNAVYDEWLNVSRLFNDEQLEVLQLIQ